MSTPNHFNSVIIEGGWRAWRVFLSVFSFPLNELGLATKLAHETIWTFSGGREFEVSLVSYIDINLQRSGCPAVHVFINLLWTVFYFYFYSLYLSAAFCYWSLFLSLVRSLLPPPPSPAHVEPPAVVASKHHPPTVITPMPVRVCPSLSGLTAPQPTFLPSMVS